MSKGFFFTFLLAKRAAPKYTEVAVPLHLGASFLSIRSVHEGTKVAFSGQLADFPGPMVMASVIVVPRGVIHAVKFFPSPFCCEVSPLARRELAHVRSSPFPFSPQFPPSSLTLRLNFLWH